MKIKRNLDRLQNMDDEVREEVNKLGNEAYNTGKTKGNINQRIQLSSIML
jgi:DNA polymerase I-like protein with 3'-5' exonuclease and polymerase domains